MSFSIRQIQGFRCHVDVTSFDALFSGPFNSHEYKWTLERKGIPCVILKRWRDTRQNQVLYRVGLDGHMADEAYFGFKSTDPILEDFGLMQITPQDRSSTDTFPLDDFQYLACVEIDFVVREAIIFIDKPLTNPTIHRKKAFRHPIGIPDDLFPDAWRQQMPDFSATKEGS